MRIDQRFQQYQATASAKAPEETRYRVRPQARMVSRSFGFRLGNFGLDVSLSDMELDPALARSERDRKQKAKAYETEAEVEGLRAEVAARAASRYDFEKDQDAGGNALPSGTPSKIRLRTALGAYAKAQSPILPDPGSMLASVV